MVSSVGCPDPTAALKHWVYGTAVALVFPAALFPSNAPLVGTLLSFATFGVGYIARPVGGLFFGHIWAIRRTGCIISSGARIGANSCLRVGYSRRHSHAPHPLHTANR